MFPGNLSVFLSGLSVSVCLVTDNGTYPFWICSFTFSYIFKRGNQRERDRERAQARGNHKPKQPKNDGLTPEQRRERDARALQEKAARKAGQSMGGGKHDHFLSVGGKIKK
ncbi:unnamed protein product [Arabis nemorensis]|uniref:Small EDRK-rich factor-like N-terminal domain-containing protein n=1 Tax=Arabis nemorensis TaxID=586526 RepID=A0A565BJ26_9BRAS|nr:unnamed protein product [Arabis nemorensis]